MARYCRIKVVFAILEKLEITDSYHGKKIWHSQVAPGSFGKLKELRIAFCGAVETVFPCGVWSNFKRLEVLSVQYCDSLQEIYQVQEEINVEETNVVAVFEFTELHIQGLHNLKHIWNKDPQQGVAFPHLRSVKVSNCKVLKDLFSASIGKGPLQLEDINIKNCCMMEEIIKSEVAGEAISNLISFPSLISIDLLKLPTLSKFLFRKL
ncbi:uncharacterized protein LOC110646590 [Hevea brasiliensis]|uniref:uncharacterized protein LOC110646590 n=1 Tax=Hevea brasiliensis TaxID=3981 RepID=UPI0025FB1F49|nr:uncharacterized protein LOC110646590 [Hevea brasiliensis]